MKMNRKAAAFITAGLMAISLCVPASMTAYAGTITIGTVNNDVDRTYTAYPIITGTFAADGKTLTNPQWGAAIDSAKLIAALKTNASTLGITLGDTPTIDDVVLALGGITDAKKIEKLAKIIDDENIITGDGVAVPKTSGVYKTADITNGWYLIKDGTAVDNENGGVLSANLLQLTKVDGDEEINPKYSLPTLDKVILQGGSEVNANTASIGDTVTYQIKTKVPDMTGYDKYFFVVNDTLSKGLTYTDTLTVTCGSALTLDKDGPAETETGDYYLNEGDYDDTNGTELSIVFENFYEKFKNKTGQDIVITYTAVLNKNAVIDGEGNPNTARLTYSNNPNDQGNGKPGKPDEPGDGAPTGKTPYDTVKTFTTQIVLDKIDPDIKTGSNKLAGVKFRLAGTGLTSVLNTTGLYVKDAEGIYYLLKDGTYTDVEAGSDTDHPATAYASTTEKYKLTESAALEKTPVTVDVEGETDANGALTFTGLNAGTYYITELKTLDGYTLLTDPIEVTIGANVDDTAQTCTWSYNSTNSNKIQIANRKGSILPSTGGIGTKLFFIFGAVMAIGSGIYLVTKKRMAGIEE